PMIKLVVLATPRDGGGWLLASPAPGIFQPAFGSGALVAGDAVIGTLDVLGRGITLVAPAQVSGHLTNVARKPVQFGEPLGELVPGGAVEQPATSSQPAATTMSGPVFRAPTSGRFYGRSSPDKPPFVKAGDELAQGA